MTELTYRSDCKHHQKATVGNGLRHSQQSFWCPVTHNIKYYRKLRNRTCSHSFITISDLMLILNDIITYQDLQDRSVHIFPLYQFLKPENLNVINTYDCLFKLTNTTHGTRFELKVILS